MTGWRIPAGGWAIDRSRPLQFTFDGKQVAALQGDTLASALLASGQRIVGRSFKYHRPRGFWGAGSEEPNGIADILGSPHRPNVQMTTEAAEDGMVLRSVNGGPTAEHDRMGFIDRFARFIPAAFYYKTFMRPDWHLFEPRIRAMAGLGRLDPGAAGFAAGDQVNTHCDVLVIGGGPAGLCAAIAAAEAGQSVILCDEQDQPGGSLLSRPATINGQPGRDWVAAQLLRLHRAGARILPGTTAFGRYDHGLTALAQRRTDGRAPRLWRVRAGETVLASGAIERALPFANNDLPGVMSAAAALSYLTRHGVAVGRRILIATTNSHAYDTATALTQAGADVTLLDLRDRAETAPCRVITGAEIETAIGRRHVTAARLTTGERLEVDTILVSGGHSPTIHLYAQAQGKLAWSPDLQAFVPGSDVPGLRVIGAAAGQLSLRAILPGADAATPGPVAAAWPKPGLKGRVWLDLQNDVTAKDVELAHRENLTSVEHLKRYTTLGMANDQGKTSNLPGLALMAELTGKTIPETGTTTYRPPFTPVPLASFAGLRGGQLMNPLRRLPLEPQHRAAGAVLREYGGWLRPAWYGTAPEAEAVPREVLAARRGVGLFDGSTLGKIEVIGPDAARFVDFIFYNTMSTLQPGRCRYGFVLTEGGIVYDDGVLVRLDQDRFIVSCSSSHVQGMALLLEEWRQDRFDKSRLFIHDSTAHYATLTVSGPHARPLLQRLDLGLALDDASLPHMALAMGRFDGQDLRITRVSFTGDRSYELTIRADRAAPLWQALNAAGGDLGAVPIGVEALMILRAEKGYIVIGKDTDGRTRPMDLGVSAPLRKKQGEFLGRTSLHLPAVADQARDLVGLESLTDQPLPCGAHAVVTQGTGLRSLGFVTTSHVSPTLNRPIALGLIENGNCRMGEVIELYHLGQRIPARIAPACALDPEGHRLNA